MNRIGFVLVLQELSESEKKERKSLQLKYRWCKKCSKRKDWRDKQESDMKSLQCVLTLRSSNLARCQ
jgi:hypothetical protein